MTPVARVRVVHALYYRFDEPVHAAELALRLTPREDARQTLEAHALACEPAIEPVRTTDAFDNTCHRVVFAGPLRELAITATSTVGLEPSALGAEVRARALALLASSGVELDPAEEPRAGSCRERTERALARLAACDVSARYCAGYPSTPGRTLPHAWLAFDLPGHGPVSFDPTSTRLAPAHVLCAVGHGYHDTAPVGGTLVASGRYALTSRVEIEAVDG